jgi:hypothetical protein
MREYIDDQEKYWLAIEQTGTHPSVSNDLPKLHSPKNRA